MNPYLGLGSGVGTDAAVSLCARLTAWHDAMVVHERRLKIRRPTDACHDECPHGEARTLWTEALATFGARARELTFLRAHASRAPAAVAVAEWSRVVSPGEEPMPSSVLANLTGER